jgi:hypothetical protein
MKTAYELAMERLNKASPMAKLTAGQKKQIAELESVCNSRIAEKEISARDEIVRAQATGDFMKVEELQTELARETRKLRDDLEEKKERVRQGKA